VRCTTPEFNVAQQRRRDRTVGRYRARTRSSGEDGAVPNFSVRRGDGRGDEAMEGTVVEGDRDEPYAGRTTGRLTGGAGLPAGVSAQESDGESGWRVGSARQRERESTGRAGARVEAGRRWAERGSRGREGGKRPRHGLDLAQLGGERVSLFLFIFQFLYPFLYRFFLLNN
jgi:hypothetical protein